MSDVILKSKDAISGKAGRAYAIINGERHLLFTIKKVKISMEKEKVDVKTIGRKVTGKKATGFNLKGEMTILEPEDIFTQMTLDYLKTGKDLYFELLIINDDPASDAGKKETIVKDCNLDSITLAELDTDKDILDQEISFSCEDVELLKRFNKLSYSPN